MAVVALGLAAPSQGDGPTEARIAAWVGVLLVVVYAPPAACSRSSPSLRMPRAPRRPGRSRSRDGVLTVPFAVVALLLGRKLARGA